MKQLKLRESKALVEVRRIKEEIFREARNDPGYYQRMNGMGDRLLAPFRKKAKKAA